MHLDLVRCTFLLVILLGASLSSALPREPLNRQQQKPLLSGEPSSPSSSFPPLEPIRRAYRLPALIASHVHADATSETAVTGIRLQGRRVQAELTDQWHLGSLGKAMTATLLAMLVKEEKVSWNSTMSELFPDLALAPAHRDTTLATVTSHRAGIKDTLDDPSFFSKLYDKNLNVVVGRKMIVIRALESSPALAKGTFNYANSDYIIAGAVIDRFSTMTWESFVQKRLFTPLNMTGCGFGPNEESTSYSVDNPWPHVPNKFLGPVPFIVPRRFRDNPPPLSSAGNIHCPIESYSKFLRAHAAADQPHPDGQPNDALGLSPEDYKHLHTPIWTDEGSEWAYTPGAWRRNTKPIDKYLPAPTPSHHLPSRLSNLSGLIDRSNNDNSLGSASSPAGTYILTHQGSNTRNEAHAWLEIPICEGDSVSGQNRHQSKREQRVTESCKAGDVYVAATNVGSAEVAIQMAIDEMRRMA